MIEAFIESPLLLLFFTIAVGYGIGQLSLGGFKLNIAAVLFVGLAIGGLNPNLHIPDFIIYFGLAVFIYSIGLSSGPTFFSNVKQNGARDIGLVLFMVTTTVTIAAGIHYLIGFDPQMTAGLYAGATTNTPALAGLIDLIEQTGGDLKNKTAQGNDAVAAYSLAYPVGIAGTLIAMIAVRRLLKINLREEEESVRGRYPVKREIVYRTIQIENPVYFKKSIRELNQMLPERMIYGRVDRRGETFLSHWDTVLEEGDRMVITGGKRDIEHASLLLGSMVEDHNGFSDEAYATKRFFVSNPSVAGQPIAALNIYEKIPAVITRIQRGDLELLPSSRTILELGDMVRLVSKREHLPGLAKIFGDSYESLGKINLLTFGMGLALGLFVGMIQFNMPGGVSFKLGFAGGPMLIALILGSLRRTGPLVWTMPHGANDTFKQFGLALLLAGIGVNAGHTFFDTLRNASSGWIILSSLTISFVSAAVSLFIGFKFMRIPFSILMGMVSHQPALLDYSMGQTNNKLPVVGFTLMMPIALIVKIIYVQLLYLFLS